MSIARKLNLLIAALAVTAGIAFTVFVGIRDYHYQRDALVMRATSLVASLPALQLNLYFQDQAAIKQTVQKFLELSPAVKHVRVFNSQTALVGATDRAWATAEEAPAFADTRDGFSPADQGFTKTSGGAVPANLAWVAKLTRGEGNTTLSLPVISVVNPTQQNLGREDFAAALAFPELVSSVHVAGYVNVTLSRTVLVGLSLPTVMASAGFGLTALAVFWFFARTITGRITAPLGMLANMADDIAAGKQTKPLRVRGSGEVKHIADVLNGVISGLHKHTKQMDADRKMLALRVDERTEQLSKQKSALSKAEQSANEARDRIRHLAYFDSLTSLPNRRLFTEQLTLLLRLASRNGDRVGLLLIDVDNFKRINDSLGSAAGDTLLKEISERLAAGVRESDVLHRYGDGDSPRMDLSRMGGDEFTVVLNQVESADDAQRVAQRLSAAIAQPYVIENQEVIVTCSIGLAIAPEQAETVEDLLRAAETAMMAAKKHGRNCSLIYDDSMAASNRERLQLENDLRKATSAGELILHYQPQVHGRTGEITGVESLVRWHHPEKGLIPPIEWIPMAEELGLIHEVGVWVLREACTHMMLLRERGLDLAKIAVNVSALQLREEFIDAVAEVLKDTGMAPEWLELEVTEGIMVNDQENTVDLVRRLKELGCRLSIDDFGTGYSSLSYLTRFPLDELKIDRSFVLGLAQGRENEELVRTIIAMARSLNLEIVVEGVEGLEQLSFFQDQDVDTIQGFLFSPPVPFEQLENLLQPGYFQRQVNGIIGVTAPGEMSMEQA